MKIQPGVHQLGPGSGALAVKTRRTGAAAKAGHDLVIDVTDWTATLVVGEGSLPTSIALEADATSLRVREGTGGMKTLTDDDMVSIQNTIDDEVLKGKRIEFRSTRVQTAGDGIRTSVEGELDLVGKIHPIAFDLTEAGDGKLSGGATIKQSDWGIKPYSTLFGALQVVDDVEVVVDVRLPT